VGPDISDGAGAVAIVVAGAFRTQDKKGQDPCSASASARRVASVAAIILTTEALVTERPERVGAAAGGMPGYD